MFEILKPGFKLNWKIDGERVISGVLGTVWVAGVFFWRKVLLLIGRPNKDKTPRLQNSGRHLPAATNQMLQAETTKLFHVTTK